MQPAATVEGLWGLINPWKTPAKQNTTSLYSLKTKILPGRLRKAAAEINDQAERFLVHAVVYLVPRLVSEFLISPHHRHVGASLDGRGHLPGCVDQ